MGIEFVQNLQATYGVNQLRSIFEGDNGCTDTSSVDYDNNATQLSNDFQQGGLEASEPEVQYTPHKERVLSLNIVRPVDVISNIIFVVFPFLWPLFRCHAITTKATFQVQQ